MIIERFKQQVKKNPQKLAIKTGNKWITFGNLYALSDQIANSLSNIIKFRPGNTGRVAILLDDAIEMIAAILGVLKSGYIYVPLTSGFPVNRIDYIIQHAEIDIFFTDFKNRDRALSAINNKEIEMVFIEKIKAEGWSGTLDFQRPVSSDTDAYLLYTSGSTGFPKGVRQTHRNVIHFIDRYIETIALTEKDNITLFSSFVHDASIVDIYASLFSGATLFPLNLTEEDFFSKLPQWLKEEKISIWHSVPTVYRYFAAELKDKDNLDFPDLRYIVLGGEAILRSDIEKFYTLSPPPCALYNLYGQTESTYNSGQFFRGEERSAGHDFSITIGEPVRGTQIFVIDEDGNETPTMAVGEIIIVSSHISPGYWKDEKSNNEKFSLDPENKPIYFSGDLGRRLIDGTIEYTGRMDNQVKVRGYRIELGEIENTVMQYGKITHVAVIGLEMLSKENYLACYFSSQVRIDIEELKKFLAERLMDYMIPSYFRQLERIPVTVSGKVDRNALPAPNTEDGIKYTRPRTDLEKKMVEIWCDVLKIEKEFIGIDNNFFQLGGHSLNAITLTAKIHKRLSIKLKLEDVFKMPTIREMVRYIGNSSREEFISIEPIEEKEYYALSSAQKRMYILQQMHKGTLIYNMPSVLLLEGEIDENRLCAAFHGLTKRHDSLRSSFITVGEEPVQKIHREADFEVQRYDISTQPTLSADRVIKSFIQPFDLTKNPMIRVGLIKLGKSKSILIIDMHHIITDGLSFGILSRDLIALYDERKLMQLRINYKDFSEWHRKMASGNIIQKQESYWLKVFQEEVTVLNIPHDYDDPGARPVQRHSIDFSVPQNLVKHLLEITQHTGTTLYIMMLAFFNILLSRYGRQEDIVVGSPVTGRNHADLQHVVGMFVNMLALRNRPEGRKSFIKFLMEVKQNVLDALENQDYQFNDLVKRLGVQRHYAGNPLFNIVLAMQNMDSNEPQEAPVKNSDHFTVSPYETTVKMPPRFDLTIFMTETNGIIRLHCRYSSGIFNEETIKRLGEHYIEIIDQVTRNTDIRLDDITLSSNFLPGKNINKEKVVDFDF